jgi:hypothetical protein
VTPISLGIFASANQSAGATSFESIATVTVGSGGASNVEFTSIPGTYTHLQIRVTSLSDVDTSAGGANIHLQCNSDTGSNYAWHELYGTGASASAGAGTSQTYIKTGYTADNDTYYTGASVIDILDYANTNKYKTVRALAGSDINGSGGYILFRSGVWMNTNAITSIKLTNQSGNLKQYSSFALYGIKAAA